MTLCRVDAARTTRRTVTTTRWRRRRARYPRAGRLALGGSELPCSDWAPADMQMRKSVDYLHPTHWEGARAWIAASEEPPKPEDAGARGDR